LLEVTDEKKGIFYPRCVAGEKSCPIEDSGGIYGYQEMLNVLKNKDNSDYESIRQWVGDNFNPDYFNIIEVNEYLQDENFGCLEIFD
jgi:hypothetical protein